MFDEDFVRNIDVNLRDRIDNEGMRPTVEVWPADDDFARWVASKEAKARAVICTTPEFKDTPFCGSGCH